MAKAKKKVEGYLSPDALMTEINNQFGANTIVRASEAVGLVKPRYSTGSFALDIVLNGGAPEGAIELIEGERTTSKSWNMLARIREFLKKHTHAIAIIVDAEQSNDPDFLRMLRVPVDRVFILRPNSGEQAWDAAIFAAEHAEKVIIGVDSLDALVPLAELEDDMEAAKYAPAAKMNNKGFRKLITAMRTDLLSEDQRVTAVFICQLRDSIGVIYGDPSKSVGGKGKDFAAAQIIRMRRKAYLQTEGKTLADRVTYGMEIEAKIVKSKGTGEGEVVRFKLYKENHEGFRRGDIDNVSELVPFLLRYKIIKKSGAWYTVGNKRVQGEENLAEELRKSPERLDQLMQEVKSVYAERHKIKSEEDPSQKKTASNSRLAKRSKAR